jgi:hypothetical protein
MNRIGTMDAPFSESVLYEPDRVLKRQAYQKKSAMKQNP